MRTANPNQDGVGLNSREEWWRLVVPLPLQFFGDAHDLSAPLFVTRLYSRELRSDVDEDVVSTNHPRVSAHRARMLCDRV